MNDGTFGVTGNLSGIDPDIIEQIEAHEFEPLAKVFWRNARLEFRTVDALQKSLRRRSDDPTLILAREPVDEIMLDHLSHNEDVARIATARIGCNYCGKSARFRTSEISIPMPIQGC